MDELIYCTPGSWVAAISGTGGDRRWQPFVAERTEWSLVQSGSLGRDYSVLETDVPIVRLDLSKLAPKRRYPVDVAESVDLPLAVGLVWAINFANLATVAAVGGSPNLAANVLVSSPKLSARIAS
jgi:hypothetical protein